MSTPTSFEEVPQVHRRAPAPRPAPIPDSRRDILFDPDFNRFARRAPASATSSVAGAGASCGPHNTTGVCERYVGSSGITTTLPIVLGVVIPLAIAFVILAVIHRRHVKKLRIEDANDPHQSLDFGMEGVEQPAAGRRPRNKKDSPEMSMAETRETLRHDRGLSMDLSSGNPYLLPPGLQQSRESLHSLSRALSNEDDRYSRANSFNPNEGEGSHSSSLRRGNDDSSIFTGSSRRTGVTEGESNSNLLRHAQRMSRSVPPTRRESVTSGTDNQQSREAGRGPGQKGLLAPSGQEDVRDSFVSTASSAGPNVALRASNNYLGAFIRGGFESADEEKQQPVDANKALPIAAEQSQQPQNASAGALVYDQVTALDHPEDSSSSHAIDRHNENLRTQPSESGLGIQHSFTLPEISIDDSSDDQLAIPHLDLPMEDNFEEEGYTYDPHRLTTEIRPLPPDDPLDNPEQRANRIRSFYKEYFEETKPGSKPAPQAYYDGSEDYADYGYDQDTAYDAAYDPAYDPAYNQNHHPGVEDYSRNGTPPPRGPPRFMGQANKPRSMSSGNLTPGPSGRPRAQSTMSGRYGSPAGAPRKKNLPPPAPLHVLPTPHMLKDDNIMLNLPIDFAPPNLARIRRAGTPDNLKGGVRPYSPSFRAHTPLTSSFDDLSIMPSPHQMRNSKTFTALSFAPSPRFAQNSNAGSDAGSIRSNRTAVSAAHVNNIRNGAYRVSRIPKELSGTKDELSSTLRPQWGMRP